MEGVPYETVDRAYESELATTYDSIKSYQLRFYYHGQWRPQYDRWVAMLVGLYAGAGKGRVAWNQALTSDMIYTQPVVHELRNLRAKTLLLIGPQVEAPDVFRKVLLAGLAGHESQK